MIGALIFFHAFNSVCKVDIVHAAVGHTLGKGDFVGGVVCAGVDVYAVVSPGHSGTNCGMVEGEGQQGRAGEQAMGWIARENMTFHSRWATLQGLGGYD